MSKLSLSEYRFLDRLYPVLCHALKKDSAAVTQAVIAYTRLFSEPDYVLYDPPLYLKQHAKELTDARHDLSVEALHEERVGAPELMVQCLRALIDAVSLEEDALLRIEVFEEEERREKIARIAVSLDGPGHFPARFVFADYFVFSLEELGERWTLATQGGRIDKAPNGFMLRLNGMRMPPEPLTVATTVLAQLGDTPEQEDVETTLSYIEGDVTPEVADVEKLFQSVLESYADSFKKELFTLEIEFPDALPPLRMQRARMRLFFVSLLECLCWTAPHGGALSVLGEYDATERELSLLITLSMSEEGNRNSYHQEALERTITMQGGTFSYSQDEQEILISATLPDAVARELDSCLPDWECFSQRSQQMLRLLKSGAQTPPEAFLLGGVLEEELERLLLPRLATPVAVNIADDIQHHPSDLKGGAAECLKKALGQIMRKKVKKEICQPKYASEILWAYRGDYRKQAAVGTAALEETELRQFCEGLIENPPAYWQCLPLLAKAIKDLPPLAS